MLLQMGPLLRLGPKVITDGTFITLGSIYYTCAFYRGQLKRETEGLIMGAQEQALRTNSIKARIDKQDVSSACRLCGERDETVAHIVAECKMLAQKQYRQWRHDKVATIIH